MADLTADDWGGYGELDYLGGDGEPVHIRWDAGKETELFTLVGGPAAGEQRWVSIGANRRPDPITVLVTDRSSPAQTTTTAVYFPRKIGNGLWHRWTLHALGSPS